MSENSSQSPDQLSPSDTRLYRWLELAVPLFSFGGIAIAFFFLSQGNIQDIRIASVGCIIASFILAYLAWIRPKKDIVALTTPLYAIILFVLPSELIPDLILPILYAISLTILLVRLKYRFGKPGTAVTMGKELGGSLKTYTDQTREPLKNLSFETAHFATLAFVQFAQGDYAKVARISETVSGTDDNPVRDQCVARAFSIVKEHAALLDKALARRSLTSHLTRNMLICWQNTCLPIWMKITHFTLHWITPSSCSTALHGMDRNRTSLTCWHASHLRRN